MSTPADQLPQQPQQQQSPLDAYMATYGQRLTSMLAGEPDPAYSAGQTSDLGPDNYSPNSALDAPVGGGPGSATPPGGPPSGAPQSALGGTPQQGQPGQGGDKGLTFRDLWSQQSKEDRQKYITQLQDHLKQTNESIDSAYKTMMQQMGGRPDTKLSRSDKGMLLMEFGLRMMEHSRPQYGQTNTLGGAIGQAGTETMQSARGLIGAKQQQQLNYDKLREQLTVAQGKDKVQLASRSALEEGRDVRALTQQNSMLERTAMQQTGAGQRNDARIAGQSDRTATTEAGKDRRAAAAAGQVKRTVTGDDGSMYGVTGNGSLVQLEKDGKTIKANPAGGPGSGKLTAAQANYNLYMATNGKDQDGKPLEGADLQNAQNEALKYAANPRSYQLSEPQMRQMSEKSADSFIRANPTSWLGMNPDEVAKAHDDYAEKEFNRLKRGGSATPVPPARPRSALEGGGGAPRGTTGAPGGAEPPTGRNGPVPSSPPSGSKGPNAQQLELLNQDPRKNAAFFLQKFGYLPREYQQFVGQQSALAR